MNDINIKIKLKCTRISHFLFSLFVNEAYDWPKGLFTLPLPSSAS